MAPGLSWRGTIPRPLMLVNGLVTAPVSTAILTDLTNLSADMVAMPACRRAKETCRWSRPGSLTSAARQGWGGIVGDHVSALSARHLDFPSSQSCNSPSPCHPLKTARHTRPSHTLAAVLRFEYGNTPVKRRYLVHHFPPPCRPRLRPRRSNTSRVCRWPRTRSCMNSPRRSSPSSAACCRILVRSDHSRCMCLANNNRSQVDSHGYAVHAHVVPRRRPRRLVQACCAQGERAGDLHPGPSAHRLLGPTRRRHAVVDTESRLPAQPAERHRRIRHPPLVWRARNQRREWKASQHRVPG